MDATKRPWTHDGKYVYDGDEKPILRIYPGGEAAIPEVVTAINNFDEMVEALERLLPVAENWACNCDINGEGPNNPAATIVREARALLAKIKEG